MKVTAIIPDKLVDEVKELTQRQNITQSLITALQEWVDLRHIKELNRSIAQEPLEFQLDFAARSIRELNRTR